MFSAQEEAELAALEAEFSGAQSISSRQAAPARKPGDLENIHFSMGMSPDEEAELIALESEFAQRPAPGPVNDKGILTQVGELVDSYTGAPVRRAIGTYQDTNDIRQAGNAFLNQFGGNPDIAPTGKEIAAKAGFSDDKGQPYTNPKTGITSIREKSDADIVGFGVDVAADWTNLLPFVPVGKLAKGAASGSKWALKNSAKATDAALGTPLVKVGEAAATTGKATLEATKKAKIRLSKLFKPEVADDYDSLADVAFNNGLDVNNMPDAIKYGENSVISRASRAKAEGPLGGEDLIKHEKFIQDVSKAAERKIHKIGLVENIPGKQEAGRILRESYDEGVDNFFKQMGETYNSAIQLAPDMQFDKNSVKIVGSKLDEMERWARGRIGSTKHLEKTVNTAKPGSKAYNQATKEMIGVLDSTNKAITKTQAQQAQEVLNAVQLAKNALYTSGNNVSQALNAMRDIGEIAFKSKSSLAEVPSDIRKFQEMYFTLQKGVTESIRSNLGDDFANALIENNKLMSKHFSDRGVLSRALGNKNISDEALFDTLIMRGDSKQIEALKSVISSEKFNQLKASYLDNLMNRGADGAIQFNSTRKKLNGMKDKLKNVFSENELIEMDDILRLGDRAGQGVLSTSGTGGSAGFKNVRNTIEDFIVNETVTDWMKKGADQRYNSLKPPMSPASAPAKSKSGIQIVNENLPLTKGQMLKASRLQSIQERNKKLELIRKQKGI
jgi:hypothetical protein